MPVELLDARFEVGQSGSPKLYSCLPNLDAGGINGRAFQLGSYSWFQTGVACGKEAEGRMALRTMAVYIKMSDPCGRKVHPQCLSSLVYMSLHTFGAGLD